MTRMWIKKVKKDLYVLMQTDGKVKREIEKSNDRISLDKRKKFLLNSGGFEGPLPTFMTRATT